MATEYDLYLASDIDSDGLLRIVEGALDLDHSRDPEDQSKNHSSTIIRSAPGFILTAYAQDPMCAETSEEWFGFRPKVAVAFRMDSFYEDRDGAYQRMLRATSAVLSRLPDDAILTLNYDTGILIRRNGRQILTEEPLTFYPEALAEIRVPYEFGRVPIAGDAPGP